MKTTVTVSLMISRIRALARHSYPRWLVIITLLLLFVQAQVLAHNPAKRVASRSPVKAARSAPRPLDKKVQVKLNAAIKDMKRAGIKPRVTSSFRSTQEQRRLYGCARDPRCRQRRALYGVNRPGTSLHEAGFAVDLGGVARQKRNKRVLTPNGRQVVKIMARHGFN